MNTSFNVRRSPNAETGAASTFTPRSPDERGKDPRRMPELPFEVDSRFTLRVRPEVAELIADLISSVDLTSQTELDRLEMTEHEGRQLFTIGATIKHKLGKKLPRNS